MATSAQTRPEPMNSSPHHSKVKVSITLANPIFVAGKYVAGKMEMECRADTGLGIGIMMVELFAVQELTSRDHTATSTFLHSRRLFQGPGLPPSNAVQAHPMPGDPSYPRDYHQARRGISTFLFRIPLPSSAPSSISFGSDLARVRYELRATVGVMWKGEKRLVVFKREIDVVESFGEDFSRMAPEAVVVGEHGKIWVQGTVVGGIVVPGESACVELQVKNHSTKKNTGLTLALTRMLVLPGLKAGETSPLQISDVLTTVPFRGLEYIIPPGAEGVASLVFDVPKHARGVRGGSYEGDESEGRSSESLFEVRCIVGITINMGFGTKDIHLDIPVPIVHPAALPEPAEYNPYYAADPVPPPHVMQSPYAHPALPMSPPIPAAYIDPVQNQVWLPPPASHTPHINDMQYFSPPVEGSEAQYYFPPPPHVHIPAYIPTRPMSAGPAPNDPLPANLTGMGAGPVPPPTSQHLLVPFGNTDAEEGKGERATRVTQHLRLSSRHRSVSPRSHRFPLPAPPAGSAQVPLPVPPPPAEQRSMVHLRNLPPAPLLLPTAPIPVAEPVVHSPRPFLSPKRSFNNSLPKSERVEELERMAEEVEKTTLDLSSDLPRATLGPQGAKPVPSSHTKVEDSLPAESDINKTLPVPPPSTKKSKGKGTPKQSGRTRIDKFFANTPGPGAPTEPQAPPTPMAAVTPVRLPKPRSAEFRAQLHPSGQGESGLDALEKRLLAEVGTRKAEPANERRPAWSVVGVQPITIPSKDPQPEDPLNDSAISSLTLAGEWMGGDREEMELDGAELDVDHDSDEKTHRAGKSSASASSRKNSKGKGGGSKKKSKKGADKPDEGNHGRKKKTTAAKGRVAAWLGGIDPEVPPMEEVLPPSPAVTRRFPPFLSDTEGLPLAEDSDVLPAADKPLPSSESRAPDDGDSAPNPRSSGFVPIGTFKAGTLQRPLKSIAKDATVIQEAKRVADIWSVWAPTPPAPAKTSSGKNQSNYPVLKDVSPAFPAISPAPVTTQSIRTDRRVSPPSAAGAVDILGAKYYNINAGKMHQAHIKPPNSKKPVPPSSQVAPLFPPQLDPEVKYDIRSARGGRGGRVTAITSIWSTAGTGPDPQPSKDILAVSKPSRSHHLGPMGNDTLKTSATSSTTVTPKLQPQAPAKSLLAASAPLTPSPNPEPKAGEFAGKRPRPIIKSTSVPAIVSSSHAVPTLSSTASLARPPAKAQAHAPKVAPTISEARTNPGRRVIAAASTKTPSSTRTVGGEMAFGQARLRDLIKKYQGQAT
ncbi:hypothetical protein DXG01_014621 [Tephrocybe rancida]|nr:hypothetical protein DXG01_014621 [Tephrocybe rancida]